MIRLGITMEDVCESKYRSCAGASQAVVSGIFFQAEDGIRDLVRSRGLGDVYKRQFYRSSKKWTGLTPGEFRAQQAL